MVKFSELERIVSGKILRIYQDREIRFLEVDSRKAQCAEGAVFFAIAGERHDGHTFIPELYRAGIRQFVVERPVLPDDYPEGNFFLTSSSLLCLQSLATLHRSTFKFPVIGITGSNGKTIVKEWLWQLLSPDHHIVKNPGSYNSQLGVPLSVWAMQTHHNLGIFEAGISQPGEMAHLRDIIQPTIGVLTNIGPAHDEGFTSRQQKLIEKLKLFASARVIIYCRDHIAIAEHIEQGTGPRLLSWGKDISSDISISPLPDRRLAITMDGKNFKVRIPFSDPASIENVCHCIALMLYLKYEPSRIEERVLQLKTIPMRLELKQGINHCQIIDDSYNNDLTGLAMSLNFLTGMKKRKNTLILSDMLQTGLPDHSWVERVAEILRNSVITSFIGIGPGFMLNRALLGQMGSTQFFGSTEEFLVNVSWDEFQNEMILVKGARPFRFEQIVQRLQKKIHGTVMEVDLSAMVHNLNFFKSKLKPGVRLMVMVKAFAYGSGSEEVTNLLQYHNVDYLGVAYPDEGVEIRKQNITLPIMVMNPSDESFPTLLEHNLEPEVFSLSMLSSLADFLNRRSCTVHLKLDTGMHRLGFEEFEIGDVISLLKANRNIHPGSLFSHLAGADDPAHDSFTHLQSSRFRSMADRIKRELNIEPVLHILNSSGIFRFPDLQMDMVRLGIGLYGINPTDVPADQLKPVATLKTIISQVRKINAGETVGYGRHGKLEIDSTVATIAIGYADGFSRSFSRGAGVVLIGGKLAPVIGNVCMDMTMVDITGIDAKEGDEVIIFGAELPIDKIAKRIDTIPYEILTSTNERVKRIFFTESI